MPNRGKCERVAHIQAALDELEAEGRVRRIRLPRRSYGPQCGDYWELVPQVELWSRTNGLDDTLVGKEAPCPHGDEDTRLTMPTRHRGARGSRCD